ncbi:hypothetical protein U1Q18_010885 [Sarracenia purpurea var. burkii]
MRPSGREPIFLSPGSRSPSSSTSKPDPTPSPPSPAPRTSKWSISPSASSLAPSCRRTVQRRSAPHRASSCLGIGPRELDSSGEGFQHRVNIVLDDVAITHLSYGTEFSKAVEQKQVAQQEAERSKFVVAKAEQERLAAIIRAEGESESARLISEATSAVGMGLIELRRIEASREIAATLAKTPNVVYVPRGNKLLFGLNPSIAGR